MHKSAKAVLSTVLCFVFLGLTGCVTLQFDDGITRNFAQQPVQYGTLQTVTQPLAETTTQIPVGNAGAAYWTQEQILALLANTVNTVKGGMSPYTVAYKESHSVGMFQISSEPMREVAESVVQYLNYEKEKSYSVSDGIATAEDEMVVANDLILPVGKPFLLSAAAVQSARASFDGENAIIVIQLKDDTANLNNPVPVNTGGIVPYITLHGYRPEQYTINSANILYSDCTLAAGIDGQGRLITVTVRADVAAEANGGLGSLTADVSLMGEVKAEYTFSYAG